MSRKRLMHWGSRLVNLNAPFWWWEHSRGGRSKRLLLKPSPGQVSHSTSPSRREGKEQKRRLSSKLMWSSDLLSSLVTTPVSCWRQPSVLLDKAVKPQVKILSPTILWSAGSQTWQQIRLTFFQTCRGPSEDQSTKKEALVIAISKEGQLRHFPTC